MSPVIATILMVAITVVLAAVLYVLVSGFIAIDTDLQTMGANVRRENSGNYTVKVISVPSGIQESQMTLTITRSSTVLIGKLALPALSCAVQGAVWVQPDPTSTLVNPGDFVSLSGAGTDCPGAPGNTFQTGDEIELGRSGKILWSGKIN